MQPLLSPDDLADASDNTPSPPPQPGEYAMNRQSQTALPSSNKDSEVSGGRATHSTTRTGGGFLPPHRADTPTTPITPSCMVAPHQRTGIRRPKASAMASPNSYSLLGEDKEPSAADDDSPPSGSSDPRATAHGWDSFVNSLNATAKGELGAVDERGKLYVPLLKSYIS